MQEQIVSKWVAAKQDLRVVHYYVELINGVFSPCKTFCFSWDGSNHQGKDTNIYIIYSRDVQKAGYLLLQTLHPVMASEVTGVVDAKVCRLSAYKQLRALGHTLQLAGLPLEAFKLPLQDSIVRPLTRDEVRVRTSNGKYEIHNDATGVATAELGPSFGFDLFKKATHLVDQCSQGELSVSGLGSRV